MLVTWLLIGIAVTAAVVLLFQDWRPTLLALLLNYLIQTSFIAEQSFVPPDLSLLNISVSTLVLIKLISGVAVTLILSITALTFAQEYGFENLDEFGLAELRRATRAMQRQRANRPFQLSDYVLPFWSGGLALLASLILPRLYPIAPSETIDFVWYWLALTGLLTIATASNLLKVGLGLLLCSSAIDLLYTAVVSAPGASGLRLMPIGLLSLFNILLALALAYLSGLCYGRLKTLDLSELYRN